MEFMTIVVLLRDFGLLAGPETCGEAQYAKTFLRADDCRVAVENWSIVCPEKEIKLVSVVLAGYGRVFTVCVDGAYWTGAWATSGDIAVLFIRDELALAALIEVTPKRQRHMLSFHTLETAPLFTRRFRRERSMLGRLFHRLTSPWAVGGVFAFIGVASVLLLAQRFA
jgi:hypothetical protein